MLSKHKEELMQIVAHLDEVCGDEGVTEWLEEIARLRRSGALKKIHFHSSDLYYCAVCRDEYQRKHEVQKQFVPLSMTTVHADPKVFEIDGKATAHSRQRLLDISQDMNPHHQADPVEARKKWWEKWSQEASKAQRVLYSISSQPRLRVECLTTMASLLEKGAPLMRRKAMGCNDAFVHSVQKLSKLFDIQIRSKNSSLCRLVLKCWDHIASILGPIFAEVWPSALSSVVPVVDGAAFVAVAADASALLRHCVEQCSCAGLLPSMLEEWSRATTKSRKSLIVNLAIHVLDEVIDAHYPKIRVMVDDRVSAHEYTLPYGVSTASLRRATATHFGVAPPEVEVMTRDGGDVSHHGILHDEHPVPCPTESMINMFKDIGGEELKASAFWTFYLLYPPEMTSIFNSLPVVDRTLTMREANKKWSFVLYAPLLDSTGIPSHNVLIEQDLDTLPPPEVSLRTLHQPNIRFGLPAGSSASARSTARSHRSVSVIDETQVRPWAEEKRDSEDIDPFDATQTYRAPS